MPPIHQEHFFLGSDFLGFREVLLFHTNGGREALIMNRAFFCPVCGEIWGRRVMLPAKESTQQSPLWRSEELYCEAHGGGSFFTHDYEMEGQASKLGEHNSQDFPYEVLKREVILGYVNYK